MLISQPENFISRNRTIKHNHLYMVDDFQGNIPCHNVSGMGLYHLDTRFLSGFEIRLHGTDPIPLLSSTEMGYFSTIVYTNAPIHTASEEGREFIAPAETIQLKRETVLYGAQFDRFWLTSYNADPLRIEVSFRLNADFRDMFDIRGIVDVDTGQHQPPAWVEGDGHSALVFAYKDRTGLRLETRVKFVDILPEVDLAGEHPTVTFSQIVRPREPVCFNMEIQTVFGEEPKNAGRLQTQAKNMDESLSVLNFKARQRQADMAHYHSDNQDFNEMMQRNEKDLRMLLTHTDEGSYLAAGIPWYVALFGRDSLITSRFCLPVSTDIARDTLKILALYQGKEDNPHRDEEPGKILHELRVGELARMGEIPHTPYYGSVDATPLFIILLYEYFQWTADLETLCELWPNALAAMGWIDRNMARHPKGYSTYFCRAERGIYQQGWKDSWDSVMDENGVVAKPPIALSEVQGYVYLAKRRMAALADFLGDKGLRQRLRRECVDLRRRFARDFWVPSLDYFAIALDEHGKQCRVISSNPGHCLETGLLYEHQAEKVIQRLMSPEMFSGWGIRTLSANALAYNPMSYHNGSVWPHDNAMVARGMAAYGRSDLVEQVFSGLFASARHMYYKRLPELFCGFRREEGKEGDPPVRYAVACSPQAWAAASMYSLVQSMLNLNVNAQKKILSIKSPCLPVGINHLNIEHLRVGQATVDLEFRRAERGVMVHVKNRHGDLNIIVEV